MEFYLCKRFMTEDYPNYSKVTGCRNLEIVSVDFSLFPCEERRKCSGDAELMPKEQLLAVLMLGKDDVLPTPEGYEFCGFDLADGEEFGVAGTSILTNCPHCFDEVSASENLNRYCLLDSRQEAERLQKLLPKQYPNEPHVYCNIYAIWRRISCFHSFESTEERREFGGSGFIELQYCKLKPSASIKKVLSLRSISYWQSDSLYVYVDDIDCFISGYAKIFGSMDAFGINYYLPAQLNDIIGKIEKQKPLDYKVILAWLKKGVEYNGIYVLGI